MKDQKIDSEVKNFLVEALSLESERKSDEEIVNELYEKSCPSFPKGEYKKLLLSKFLSDFRSASKEYGGFEEVAITEKEWSWLASVKSIKTKKQLTCLLLWKKTHPHPSGWIKFDHEEIFSLLFSPKEIKQMDSDTRGYTECFGKYSELRVIGSKNPIVCYALPKELEEDSPNFLSVNIDDGESLSHLKNFFNIDWETGEFLGGGVDASS